MMDDEEDPQSANRLCLHNFSATNLVRNTFFKRYFTPDFMFDNNVKEKLSCA